MFRAGVSLSFIGAWSSVSAAQGSAAQGNAAATTPAPAVTAPAVSSTSAPGTPTSGNTPVSSSPAVPSNAVPSNAAPSTAGSGTASATPGEETAAGNVGAVGAESSPAPGAPPIVGVPVASELQTETAVNGPGSDAVRPTGESLESDEPAANEIASGGDDEPSGPTDPAELELSLRVIGGFEHEKEELEPEAAYGFRLRQVRTSFRLKWKKRWYTRATVDFADGIEPESGVQYIRTATLEYRHSKKLRFTLGRFKRPFSYLELQSTGDLPILNRGLLNDLVIEESAWGDRGIGAMVSGKYKPAKLGYKFSITNPAPPGLATAGLDTIARLEWDPLDEIQVGVHGGNKFVDFDEGRKHFQAFGADVRLRIAGLEWQVEGMIADQPWRRNAVTDASLAYGATTLISYTQPLTKHLTLMPVVFGEYADANSEYEGNESVRFQGGVNLVIRQQFRIMPQVRLTRALGEPLRSAPPNSPEFMAINPWDDGTQFALYFSLAL